MIRKMHRRLESKSLANGRSGVAGGSHITDESEQEDQVNNGVQKHNGKATTGLAISDTGFCALCGKNAVCKCERCGDFYCSPQCQRKDWPNHRFICFPMPRLIKAGGETHSNEALPVLRTDVKPIEITKEESRQGHRARQLGYIPSPTPLPTDGSRVVLVGFKSANRCYIRSADPTVTADYNKILRKIDDFGKHSNDITGVPKANTFAIAQRNEKWCRVQILSARPDNRIRVHFIDYGVISVRYLRELRRISGTMSSLPCYANMVQLHDITMYTMQSKVLQQLAQYDDKEFKLQFVEPDNIGGNVKLYHIDTNELLNTEIINICLESSDKGADPASNTSTISNENDEAEKEVDEKDTEISSSSGSAKTKREDPVVASPQKDASDFPSPKGDEKKKILPSGPRQLQKPCFVPPFEIKPFDTNATKFKVIVVDNTYVSSGYLGCLLQSDCNNLQTVQKFLEDYSANEQPPYKPKLEEYCIAQFESEWYRGKVVEILGEDKFLVTYIDFTNECELTSESIRRYPIALTVPCGTNLCAIEGLPETLSDKMVEYLKKELGDFKKLTVDKAQITDGVTFIECKELLNKLHESKLL